MHDPHQNEHSEDKLEPGQVDRSGQYDGFRKESELPEGQHKAYGIGDFRQTRYEEDPANDNAKDK